MFSKKIFCRLAAPTQEDQLASFELACIWTHNVDDRTRRQGFPVAWAMAELGVEGARNTWQWNYDATLPGGLLGWDCDVSVLTEAHDQPNKRRDYLVVTWKASADKHAAWFLRHLPDPDAQGRWPTPSDDPWTCRGFTMARSHHRIAVWEM